LHPSEKRKEKKQQKSIDPALKCENLYTIVVAPEQTYKKRSEEIRKK
jgi:hypothetical protein